jgi:hypothetical protein
MSLWLGNREPYGKVFGGSALTLPGERLRRGRLT